MDEPRKALVLRGQKDKVVAIYRENDAEIIRAELPHKEWQGLTDEEVWGMDAFRNAAPYEEVRVLYLFARAIEAKLKEKNA